MTIFDGFRKRKKIPSPWDKYYSEEDINIKIPNTSFVFRNTKKHCEWYQ